MTNSRMAGSHAGKLTPKKEGGKKKKKREKAEECWKIDVDNSRINRLREGECVTLLDQAKRESVIILRHRHRTLGWSPDLKLLDGELGPAVPEIF